MASQSGPRHPTRPRALAEFSDQAATLWNPTTPTRRPGRGRGTECARRSHHSLIHPALFSPLNEMAPPRVNWDRYVGAPLRCRVLPETSQVRLNFQYSAVAWSCAWVFVSTKLRSSTCQFVFPIVLERVNQCLYESETTATVRVESDHPLFHTYRIPTTSQEFDEFENPRFQLFANR